MPSSGYSAWSVIAGEQPTTSKWNILGSNDASFNTGNGFNDGVIVGRHLASAAINSTSVDWSTTGGIWWQELGRATLGANGNTITIASFTARKYLKILASVVPTGGTISAGLRFNNDSSANYAIRQSPNGGADATAASQTQAGLSIGTNSYPYFFEIDVVNIAAQEKIGVMKSVEQNTAGAGNAPAKAEETIKWANTAAQISRVDLVNGGTGNYLVGSEVVVLGHD